jgi:penicillin-binding protein 1A
MKKSQLILRFVIFLPFGGFLAILVGFLGLYLYLAPTLPAIDELRNIQLQVPLRVYSKDQKLIAEFGEKRRTPIRYEEVPPLFIDAIKAAEDDNFEAHIGIDIKGLTRAAIQLVLTGEKRSGGSTITMQVARNYFLTPEKTFKRKFIEIMLALHIDDALSKTEIMELYINKIFLGKRAYGIEAAANIYYGKSINELTLPQLAMIAGIPKAPTAYNPINNPERAIQRRNYVLSRMYELNKIDQVTYETAITAPVSAQVYKVQAELEANYVAELVRAEMLERFPDNAYTHGYQVITSIEAVKQQAANQALQAGLLNFDQAHGLRNVWATLETRYIENTEQPDLGFWLEQLQQKPSIGPLIPAVVTEVFEQSFTVLLQSGQFAKVTDFKWARTFKTINSLGPNIKQASEVVAVGHQVWVTSSKTSTTDEENRIEWLLAQPPSIQGALISLNPNSGALESLVGGFDFHDSKFNRAVQSDRQPGSSFKPFVYSAALNAGLTPATLINDAPVVFEDANLEGTWRPKNNSGQFYGPTRLRKALYKSRNLVTIRIMQRIGVRSVSEFLTELGFNEAKINQNLSLALGASAFTPMEMATAYATLANGGYRVEPYLIEKILDHENQVVYERPPVIFCDHCYKPKHAAEESNENTDQGLKESENVLVQAEPPTDNNSTETDSDTASQDKSIIAPRVMDARVNYLIYTMMQDVIQRGTGRRARVLNRVDLAGKTGTTNDQRDLWFSGFTPDVVTTVWVGFDDYAPLGRNSYGSNVPLPIWINYMREALKQVPTRTLQRPEGLVNVRIDPISGLKAPPEQNDAIFEIFREENVPEEFATLRHDMQSDSETGDLAEESDPILPEQLF